MIGFVNGCVISELIHISYILWDSIIGHPTPFATVLEYLGMAFFASLFLAGIPGAILFALFDYYRLHKVPFWKMWSIAFPTTYALCFIGFSLGSFAGGYGGAVISMLITTLYLRWKDGVPSVKNTIEH